MILQVCAAMVETVVFSLLSGVPGVFYPWCGTIGGAGRAVYVLTTSGGCEPAGASFIAVMVVTFLSRSAAVRDRCPITISLVSDIFPLVPEASIYWTTYYLVTEQLYLAVYTRYEAMKMAVTIILRIVPVFELPQGIFR